MTNDWSLCNASECGGKGEETQGYKCELYYMNNDTYEQADMDLCDIQTAPIVTRTCTGPPCNFNWTAGNWSQVRNTFFLNFRKTSRVRNQKVLVIFLLNRFVL